MHRLKSVRLTVATLCLCLSPSIPAGVSPAIAESEIAADFRNQRQKLIAQENEAQTPPNYVATEQTGEQSQANPKFPQLCQNLHSVHKLGHLVRVTALTVTPDGELLITGDKSGVIRIWNLKMGELVQTILAYLGEEIGSISISPDGKTFVSHGAGTYSRTDEMAIKVWNLKTGELLRTLKDSARSKLVIFSSDGKMIIAAGGIDDGKIRLWDFQTGELVRTMAGHSFGVESISLTPDGQNLISRGSNVVNNSVQAEETRIWNLQTGELIRTNTNVPTTAAEVTRDVLSPDRQMFVRAENSGITLFNRNSGSPLCSLPRREVGIITAFSPDGQKLIVAGGDWKHGNVEVLQFAPNLNPPQQNISNTEIERLNRLGLEKLRRRQFYSAFRTFWQLFEMQQKRGDRLGQGQALYHMAEASYGSCQLGWGGCFDGGYYEEYYKLAIPILKESGDQARVANALSNLGKPAAGARGTDSYSLPFLQEALEIRRAIGDRQGEWDTLISIGAFYIQSNQAARGQEFFKQAIALGKKLNSRTGERDTLIKIGLAVPNIQKQIFEQALKIDRARGDRKAEAATLSKIGKLEGALKIYREIGDRKAEANILTRIAHSKFEKFEHKDESHLIKSLEQILAIRRSVGDRAGEAEILHSIGQRYRPLGYQKASNKISPQVMKQEAQKAIKLFQKAVSLYRNIGDLMAEGAVLIDLADVYRLDGQYALALDTYQRVLGIRQKVGDSVYEEIVLYRIGLMHHRLQQYPQALEAYQKAVSICQEIGTDCLYSRQLISFNENIQDILNNIGEVYLAQAHYTKALTFFQQTTGNDIYRAFTNIGLAYDGMRQDSQAFTFFDMAIKARKCAGYGDGARVDATLVEAIRFYALYDEWMASDTNQCNVFDSQAFAGRAEIYRKRGQYSNALEDYRKALKLFTDFGMQDQQAAIFNNIGVVYKSLGDYPKALKAYQQALAIRKELKDKLGEATKLNNIGEIYRNQGQYTQALESYRQAFAIFEALELPQPADAIYWGSSNRDRTCWNCYGNGYSDATLGESVATRNTHFRKASALHNMGVVHDELGQYSEALKFYAQALVIRKNIEDRAGEAATLNNMGLVYQEQQQYSTALKYYQNSLALRRTAEDRPGEATTLNNIGLVHEKLGQPALGIEPIQQALAIFRELGDKANEGNTLDSLGTIYTSLGQFDKALQAYQQALGLLRETGNRPIERVTLSHVGDLFKQQNQPELAIAFYKQSVNLTETIRDELRSLPREQQESYTQTVIGTYRNLAALLIQQGRLPEAHAVLELLKLRELSQFTREAGINSPGISLAKIEEDALNSILKQFTTLGNFAQELAKCEQTKCSNLKQLEQQRDTLFTAVNRELKQQRALLAKHFSTEVSTLTPEKLNLEARRIVNAQPGTVLIYPLVLKDKIQFLLAVKTGDGAVTFRPFETQVTAEQLFKTIQTFRQQLGETTIVGTPKTDLATVQATSQKLYSWLIKPLEAELSNPAIKHLVFAPDSTTRYIPLAALHDGKRYLIDRFTISTITAAIQTDTEARTPRPTGQQPMLLAMGASTFQNQSPLPNVPAELDAITKTNQTKDRQGIYPGSKFLDQAFDYKALKDALKKNLEKKTYRILHLATHGAFKAGRPEDSYLVPGRGNNLTTELIEQLGNAGLGTIHLVVLSACETAVGDRASDGIEIPGISYYFLKDGVDSVMASLWNVNDASTALIMQQFYKHIAAGMTKAQALQTIQQDLINSKFTAKDAPKRSSEADIRVTAAPGSRASRSANFAHPYYWAPFILIGNSL
ncbi:MAG: tetratricopeptide repeat protein [Leptolyngbyaceae cyanobacterium bins.302]|nr:tetratricopeptide repeat protein [Leptolyngbyaceae cyanobacterium bins.302]